MEGCALSFLDEIIIKADQTILAYNRAKLQIKEEKLALHKAKEYVDHVEQAQVVLQTLAQSIQQEAHQKIAQVVSKCLEAIFDDPYKFEIEFERKRGRTEAKLLFVRSDNKISPLKASGGGVVDVAAFALRLACLILAKPKLRRVMVMDEPFKFLHSPVYRARLVQLLETLADEMGVQFILVTQSYEFQCGKVIRLEGKQPDVKRTSKNRGATSKAKRVQQKIQQKETRRKTSG
jgi:hypothetical protein